MALVKCSDCGRDVSDAAPACPGCGRPVEPAPTSASAQRPEPAKTAPKSGGGGCGVLLVAFAWMFAAGAGLIVVLVILGSLVPKSKPTSPRSTQETAAGTAAPAPTSSGNRAHDLLIGRPDVQRNKTLSAFLAESGESCDVERSFFQGLDKELSAYWNVACEGGKSYVVTVKNDATGSTRILDCGVLKAVSGVECFKKF